MSKCRKLRGKKTDKGYLEKNLDLEGGFFWIIQIILSTFVRPQNRAIYLNIIVLCVLFSRKEKNCIIPMYSNVEKT